MMLNRKLYELLPAIYIGTGTLIAVALESPVKYIPSMMFVSAGVLILTWRARHRGRQPARAQKQTSPARLRARPQLGHPGER